MTEERRWPGPATAPYDTDGRVTSVSLARSFTARTRSWIVKRLIDANNGARPLPGVAVSREGEPGRWRLTFARHCSTCNLNIPDGMAHPHNLTSAAWETP